MVPRLKRPYYKDVFIYRKDDFCFYKLLFSCRVYSLIKGADIFVDGTSSLALNCKLSKCLLVCDSCFGTSAPEFAVSVKSIMSNNLIWF